MCRFPLLILATVLEPLRAVHLQVPSPVEVHGSPKLASRQVMREFGEKIMKRFDIVDEDKDGTVSLLEMKKGFGHEPSEHGEEILARMLSECAGNADAKFCSRKEMESSLKAWMTSRRERTAMGLLQTNIEAGFPRLHRDEPDETPCGPSAAEPPASGLENIKCTWQGARCWKSGGMTAWSLNEVCVTRGCVCEASKETKRLAKLGLMGALAATTAKNFSDPEDILQSPACGDHWQTIKVVGHLKDIDSTLSWDEKLSIKAGVGFLKTNKEEQAKVIMSKDDDTEVVIFKSPHHKIHKDGPPGKVCMISWQATRSAGDWKTNLMLKDAPFPYSPRDESLEVPKGIALAYGSVRDKLKRTFEEQCCSWDFRADKVVISGHSHGGAMAELNAIDVVTWWSCAGRDLGAKDIALVTAGPHASMLKMSTVNKVFSCNDPRACLSGSVVTLVTKGDIVGEGQLAMPSRGAPRHPAAVYQMECPEVYDDTSFKDETAGKKWWCHGIFNYVSQVEQVLVGREGWGSSCGGACGHPNRHVQCNLFVLIKEKGCAYATNTDLKLATPCTNRWIPEEERCDCHYDHCGELTTLGCKS